MTLENSADNHYTHIETEPDPASTIYIPKKDPIGNLIYEGMNFSEGRGDINVYNSSLKKFTCRRLMQQGSQEPTRC